MVQTCAPQFDEQLAQHNCPVNHMIKRLLVWRIKYCLERTKNILIAETKCVILQKDTQTLNIKTVFMNKIKHNMSYEFELSTCMCELSQVLQEL